MKSKKAAIFQAAFFFARCVVVFKDAVEARYVLGDESFDCGSANNFSLNAIT